MSKKVTELTEATKINDDDLLMTIQSNENKKIKFKNLIANTKSSLEQSIDDTQKSLKSSIDEVSKRIDGTTATSLKIDNVLIQSGLLENLEVPENSYKAYTVTFKTAYIENPQVIAQVKGNYNVYCTVASASSTQFIIDMRSLDGTERTGRSVSWIAIGRYK